MKVNDTYVDPLYNPNTDRRNFLSFLSGKRKRHLQLPLNLSKDVGEGVDVAESACPMIIMSVSLHHMKVRDGMTL